MVEMLKQIAKETTDGIHHALNGELSREQTEKIEHLIQNAIIKALLEGQHRAVDAALLCPEADQDMAHKIATEIRRSNDVLIANLASLR